MNQGVVIVDYCAKSHKDILSHENLELRWARGMLYLLKRLRTLQNNDFSWPTCSIRRTDTEIEFDSPTIKMKSKL